MNKAKFSRYLLVLLLLYSSLPGNNQHFVKAKEKNPLTIEKVIGLSTIPGTFRKAQSIAVAKDGTIFIVDTGESQIEVYDSSYKYLRSFGSIGSGDGQFHEIRQISFDTEEKLYILDVYHRIQVFTKEGKFIRKMGGTKESFYPMEFVFLTTGEMLIIAPDKKDGMLGCNVYTQDGDYIRDFFTEIEYKDEGWFPLNVITDDIGYVYFKGYRSSNSEFVYSFLKFNPDGSFACEFVKTGNEERDIVNKMVFLSPDGFMTTEDNLLFITDGSLIKKYEIPKDPKQPLKYIENYLIHSEKEPEKLLVEYPSAGQSYQHRLYILDSSYNRLVVLSEEEKTILGIIQSPILEYGKMYPKNKIPSDIFSNPQGIMVGSDGNFYVANSCLNKISIFNSEWKEIGSIGKPPEKQKKEAGELVKPIDMAINYQGNLFVLDAVAKNGTIEVFSKNRTPLLTYPISWGYGGGVAVNSIDNLVIFSDYSGLQILDISQVDDKKISQINIMSLDGMGAGDLIIDQDDNMVVSFSMPGKILWLNSEGKVLRKLNDWDNKWFSFEPYGLCHDGAGNVYACELFSGKIHKISPKGERIWTSDLGWKGLDYITMDAQGKLFVTDSVHNVVLQISDSTAIPPIKKESPPKLTVKPVSTEVFDPNLLIEGETDPGATVMINQQKVGVEEDGTFSTTLKLIKGVNTINIVATNKTKKQTSITLAVTLKEIADTIPPSLKLKPIPAIVYEPTLVLNGETEPEATVKANAKEVSVNQDGTFETTIDLQLGENTIQITATDKAGNHSDQTLKIVLKEKIIIKLVVGSKEILIKGVSGILDSEPFIDKKSGRTMVPLRAIAEAIGASVTFQAKEQRIDILKDSVLIQLWIGKPKALVNNKEVAIDTQSPISPMIVKGRTFLPLRFIAETFEFEVDWDPKTQGITLTYPKG